ncbi:MAG: zinc ABC transporter substrate-binding protein [Ilumatobacteraceae bacterium]|nr:zinc ABC transporter substrate-binding protein [Ilumatobacteraceae bacterium]
MILIAGCAGSEQTSNSRNVGCDLGEVVQGRPLNIATTVAPITSIIANIAGGTSTSITGIVPEGTNSHTFEPKPSDAASLESADVIFINGLVLEEPTKDLAIANLKESANICELGTETLPESEYIYDFSFPKEGGKPNPHLWTDPPMAKQYAQVARDLLVRRDPVNAAIYEKNFVAFAVKIDALDNAIKIATATIPENQRKLLTYHDAYAYFAKNYGYTVVGAIQPSSFDEPTPKEIAALILQVKELGVKAIFGSEVFPSPVLEQIGLESDVRYVDVLRDDDLIGKPGDKEHSWLGLMRFNFVTIVEALGGDASALKLIDVQDVVKDGAKYSQ